MSQRFSTSVILYTYSQHTRVISAYSTHTPRRAPSSTHTLCTLPRYVRPVQHAIGAFSPHTYASLKRKTHLSARRALIPSSSRRQCAVNCSGVPQLNGRFQSASPLRRVERRFVAITRTGFVHDGRCPLYSSNAFKYTLSVYAVSCRRSMLRTLYVDYKKILTSCCPKSKLNQHWLYSFSTIACSAARLKDMYLEQLIRHCLCSTARLVWR